MIVDINETWDKKHAIKIFPITDEGDLYYFAYYPSLGRTTCSAVGDTPEEALKYLRLVRADVIKHFVDEGRALPDPEPPPFGQDD